MDSHAPEGVHHLQSDLTSTGSQPFLNPLLSLDRSSEKVGSPKLSMGLISLIVTANLGFLYPKLLTFVSAFLSSRQMYLDVITLMIH